MKSISKLILSFFLLLSFTASAQVNDIGEMLSGGIDDGEKLLKHYLSPFSKAFGADLNSAWSYSAKPHEKLGFDITFSVNAAFVPDVDKTFDVKNIDFSVLELKNPAQSSVAPTAAGEQTDGPQIHYTQNFNGQEYEMTYFKTPQGTGLDIVPAPMLQGGIGLIKNTELKVRFMPKTSVQDAGSVSLWGVGFQHGLKQWIPVLKRMPVIQLSLMAGYTSLNGVANIDFQPPAYGNDVVIETQKSFDNQEMDIQIKSLTASILVGANFPVVSIYGGIGVCQTNTTLKLLGNYPVTAIETDPSSANYAKKVVRDSEVLTDPVDISLGNKEGIVKPGLNAGVRFRLSVIAITFSYTYSEYSVISGALGISIR